MNLSLKNVKYCEFGSRETDNFEATVCVDGKAVFIVSNDGGGGPSKYSTLSAGRNLETLLLSREINEHLARETIFGEFGEIQNSLELAVGKLMETWLSKKRLRLMLNKVCIIEDGELLTFLITNKRFDASPDIAVSIQDKYPNAQILNSLTFEEAFEKYEQI